MQDPQPMLANRGPPVRTRFSSRRIRSSFALQFGISKVIEVSRIQNSSTPCRLWSNRFQDAKDREVRGI
jgi:hypothetical protein